MDLRPNDSGTPNPGEVEFDDIFSEEAAGSLRSGTRVLRADHAWPPDLDFSARRSPPF